MNKLYLMISSLLLMVIVAYSINARMFRVNQIPNGSKFQCSNCHISAGGGGTLTPFGADVKKNLAGENVNWSATLANLDSDSDGFTNGQELLDPDGTWTLGSSDPGNQNNVGNPGNENSTPIISSIEELASSMIQINPNPIRDNAALSFSAKNDMFVSIVLIKLTGVVVANIFDGFINEGNFYMNWQPVDTFGNKLPAGVYLVSIRSEGQSIATRIVIE